MKKIIVLLLLTPAIAQAQVSILAGKNIIKTNLTSYALNNYNLTYERSLFKRMSISVGFRYMPKTSVPFQSEIEKAIDNKDIKVADFQMGNTAITPEFRFYFGLGKMKGFYIAPYARFASFDIQAPILYDDNSGNKKEVFFNGTIKSISGGVLLGVQKHILKKLVLDIWIIGGHYGNSDGTLNADMTKNPIPYSDIPNLQAKLDDIQVNSGPFKFTGKVNSTTSADIFSTGPWAGIRALGLSLGVRF
jgi:Protein of unknown function (DUF3575)